MKVKKVHLKKIQDEEIKTPNFNTKVRLYYPELNKKLPLILFMHGGGWVAGNINTHDNTCRQIAKKTNCTVLSVDYLLAPENKFPAALNQIIELYTELPILADKFNFLYSKTILCGDSAGANFSAILSHKFSNKKDIITPTAQILLYPAINMKKQTKSKIEFSKGFMLDKEQADWFYNLYTNKHDKDTNPDISPDYFTVSPNHPRTLIITAGHDPLRDEGKEYYEKLINNKINAEYYCFESMIHAFVAFESFKESEMAIDKIAEFVKSL